MKYFPIIHILFAAICTLSIGLATHQWWAGAAGGAAFYVGREFTQAEYRWIDAYGLGKRANMPLLGGLDYRVWNLKSLLDFILPTLVAVVLAAFMQGA